MWNHIARWGGALALVLWFSSAASGQVYLFSSLDRDVAAVGESFLLTIELWSIEESADNRDALVESLRQVEIPEDSDLELIRALRPRLKLTSLYDQTVISATRKFVLKPLRKGQISVPTVEISVGGSQLRTEPHDLMAHRFGSDFSRVQRSILPLLVRTELDTSTRTHFVSNGSAFLAAEDAVVTAYHVVVNASRIDATLPNGKRVRLDKVWAMDPLRDIAVLYIDPDDVRDSGLEPLEIASRDLRSDGLGFQGEPEVVFTSGWPSGVQRSQAGVLFAVNQYYDNEAIWLSSNYVRPGDSGGPLLNERSQVIGVISYAMSGRRSGTQLLDNVATSTDPRPALARRLLQNSPHGIGRYRRDDFFERNPHAMAAKAASILSEFSSPRGRALIGGLDPYLRQIDAAADANAEARIQFLKGSVYQMLGDYGDAKQAYEIALDQSVDHYPAAYSLAYCQLALRSYETAAELFDFIADFEPYENLARYGLAQADLQLLRYESAIENLTKVVHDNGQFAPGLYLLARAHLGLGQENEASLIQAKLETVDARWARLFDRTRTILPFRPVRRYMMPEARLRLID